MLRWLVLVPMFFLPLPASCKTCNSASEVAAPGTAEEAQTSSAHGVPFDDVVILEAGGDETCVVVRSGATYCAGGTRGRYGKVDLARPIAGAEQTVQLSLGSSSCAVQRGGEVVCWGENGNRVLPNGTGKYDPVLVPELPPASHVVASLSWFFPNWVFVRDDASVWRWGEWEAPGFVPASQVEQIKLNPVQVESSNNFYCARTEDGEVTCWDLQGNTADATHVSIKPTPVFLPSDVTDIALSYPSLDETQAACSLDLAGRAVCWRYAGDDLTTAQPLDHPLAGNHGWKDIAMKDGHACGAKQDGSVWCTGGNRHGQLGRREPQESESLLEVPGVTGAKAVTVGRDHSCALLASGSVMCWGYNRDDQCGTAQRAKHLKPSVFLRYVGDVGAP